LTYSGYNQTKAAKALGLSRSTLRKKLEQYGLS
jgi:Fis family transcriptional regulator